MKQIEDLTGRRYGRLVVLGLQGQTLDRVSIWRVRCDCGCEFLAYRTNLMAGKTRSCGCLRRERMMEKKRRATK